MEEHVFDLLPAYALGCLDQEDFVKVSRHLADCAVCQNELATYYAAADQLAMAAPLRTPPLELKQKILQRVAAPQPEAAAQSQPDRSPETSRPKDASRPSDGLRPSAAPRPAPAGNPHKSWDLFRGLFAQPLGLAFAVAALLLIIFMGISNLLLWQRVNELQARAPKENMQLVRLDGTTNAPNAQGYIMVFKNETYGTLVVENAPALQAGYQYQLWLIRDGKRTSGGVFSVTGEGYGTLEVSADQPLENYPSFGITIEPAGGSLAPTGKKVLGGKL